MKQRLIDLIAQGGPLTLAQFMSEALYHPSEGYYTTRVALGAAGDFITAPETSQMFGELVGLWAAQCWMEMGAPRPFTLTELGPGSGVMMTDMLRAARAIAPFNAALRPALVEVSPALRDKQQRTLAESGFEAFWFETLEQAFTGPGVIVGNEFLDCMPIRQFIRTREGWRERVVGLHQGALAFGLAHDPPPPDLPLAPALRNAPEGAVAEVRPGLAAFLALLAARLTLDAGHALFFDYGGVNAGGNDTFQALKAHASADPLDAPGHADLTAHVDFSEVKRLGQEMGLAIYGPTSQGDWLRAMGIETRAAALQSKLPTDQALRVGRQLNRLIGDDQMGKLFQAICLSSPGAPPPPGFGGGPMRRSAR